MRSLRDCGRRTNVFLARMSDLLTQSKSRRHSMRMPQLLLMLPRCRLTRRHRKPRNSLQRLAMLVPKTRVQMHLLQGKPARAKESHLRQAKAKQRLPRLTRLRQRLQLIALAQKPRMKRRSQQKAKEPLHLWLAKARDLLPQEAKGHRHLEAKDPLRQQAKGPLLQLGARGLLLLAAKVLLARVLRQQSAAKVEKVLLREAVVVPRRQDQRLLARSGIGKL
mmetsp:Transcript_43168/g.101465  ORF Transcript_43168/g.101465 Transcript_43168/m.101465 type:complete len:221 (-) Transcript_43168:1548-2210(-)